MAGRPDFAHVGDQVGLKFDRPFDISVLAKSKPEVAETPWTRPAYIKSGRPGAGEPEWDHTPLGDLRDSLEGFLKR